MKYKELARALTKMGYSQLKGKGPHEKWNNGRVTVRVPRHKEINEYTARGILSKAKENME